MFLIIQGALIMSNQSDKACYSDTRQDRNTEVFTVKPLDFIQGVIPIQGLNQALPIVEKMMVTGDSVKSSVENPKWHHKNFTIKDTTHYGFIYAYNDHELYISIPGSYISRLSHQEIWELIQRLVKLNFRPTRLDLNIDAPKSILSLDDIEQAILDEHLCHAVRCTQYQELKRGNKIKGRTIYIGSHQSHKYIRIYDKEAESGGAIKANRFEAQLRVKYAMAYWNEIKRCKNMSDLAKVASNVLINLIDFRDKYHHQAIDKAKRLPWWDKFCKLVGKGLKLTIERVKPTLLAATKWINHQVSKTLACLKIVLDDRFVPWLEQELAYATYSMGTEHISRIIAWENELLSLSSLSDDLA